MRMTGQQQVQQTQIRCFFFALAAPVLVAGAHVRAQWEPAGEACEGQDLQGMDSPSGIIRLNWNSFSLHVQREADSRKLNSPRPRGPAVAGQRRRRRHSVPLWGAILSRGWEFDQLNMHAAQFMFRTMSIATFWTFFINIRRIMRDYRASPSSPEAKSRIGLSLPRVETPSGAGARPRSRAEGRLELRQIYNLYGRVTILAIYYLGNILLDIKCLQSNHFFKISRKVCKLLR